MANSRISVISNEIFRRYFGVGEFPRLNYYLLYLPINPVYLMRVLIKLRGACGTEKDLEERLV